MFSPVSERLPDMHGAITEQLDLECNLCGSRLEIVSEDRFIADRTDSRMVEYEVACRDCDGLQDDPQDDAVGEIRIFKDGVTQYTGIPY